MNCSIRSLNMEFEACFYTGNKGGGNLAKEYDLVIVGGGIGGYTAAIRASQLGMKTALVEKKKLGGTCLHKGCIPTKSLLKSAQIFRYVNHADNYGIHTEAVSIDFVAMQKRKDQVIDRLHKGLQQLIKKNGIDVYSGNGRLLGPSIFSPLAGSVSVDMGQENEILIGKHVLLATGSVPRSMPDLDFDGDMILSSDDCLTLETLPNSVIIIGGGVIGVEFASLFADFGVQVTIVEAAASLIPAEDEAISKALERSLRNKGVQILTKAKILPRTVQKDEQISLEIEFAGERKRLEAEKVLVAIGREPFIRGIGLENTNIQWADGFINTNEYYQTAESHIYAIGDCTGGMQLAHVAAKEGMIAVEHMAGKDPEPLDVKLIPRCIYSDPEVASIGLSEKEAREKGFDLKTAQIPFQAIGKALVNGKQDGFAKIIVDKKTDDILGLHMIGDGVTELIGEASLAFSFDASPDEVAFAIHAHPTLSEVIAEVVLAVDGKAIYY